MWEPQTEYVTPMDTNTTIATTMSLQALTVSQLLSLDLAINSYRALTLLHNATSTVKPTTCNDIITNIVQYSGSPSKQSETTNVYASNFDLSVRGNHDKMREPFRKKSSSFFVKDILSPEFGDQCYTSQIPLGPLNLKKRTSLFEHPSDGTIVRPHSNVTEKSLPSYEKTERRSKCAPSSPAQSLPPTKTRLSPANVLSKNFISPLNRLQLPAWVFCTRYSDRPSSGPRMRKPRRPHQQEEVNLKRPRTSFTSSQLRRLAKEFEINRYLDESRRRQLASELNLRESQVKIWFQNKRAKTKKACGTQDRLAFQLMAEGLYNHSVRVRSDLEEQKEAGFRG